MSVLRRIALGVAYTTGAWVGLLIVPLPAATRV